MSVRLASWTGRLGGPRLASAILLDALGSGALIPLGILFFTIHQHMHATTVGLGLTIGGAASIVLTPLGGQLIDAVGAKRALIGSWLASAVVAVAWVFVHDLPMLSLVMALEFLFGGLGWNATTALLADVSADAELSTVMATQYSLKNFGFGAGGLLSTLALGIGGVGFDIAVYINAASFLAGLLLVLGVSAPAHARPDPEVDATTIWTVLRHRRYVALALLGGLISFNQIGLTVILPLWIVTRTHAPRELVGLLFTLNTVLVVTCQLWLAGSVRELPDAPRAYLRAAVAMFLAAVAYLASHYVGALPAVGLLVAGTILMTVTEMLSSACSFVVSLRLADPEHRGKYLSVFSIGWSLENTVGPTAGTALAGGVVLLPWLVIAATVAAGALASAGLVRREPSGRA